MSAAQAQEEPEGHDEKLCHARALLAFCLPLSSLYDHVQLVVVGGGPGGYAAAFLAADLGLSVALVDPEANPGGVCVYRGCIPRRRCCTSRTSSAKSRHAKAWGVEFGEPKVDLAKLREFKNNVVKRLTRRDRAARQGPQDSIPAGSAEIVDGHKLLVKPIGGGSTSRSSSSTPFLHRARRRRFLRR
jgi:dihydrolipoamide dehydrogenase